MNRVLALTCVIIATCFVLASNVAYWLQNAGSEEGILYVILLHMTVPLFLALFLWILPTDQLLLPVWAIASLLWAITHAVSIVLYGMIANLPVESPEPGILISFGSIASWISLISSLTLTGCALWVALRTRLERPLQPLRTLAMFVLFFFMVSFSLALALALEDKSRRASDRSPGLLGGATAAPVHLLGAEDIKICRENAVAGAYRVAPLLFLKDNIALPLEGDFEKQSETDDCRLLETAGQRNQCHLLDIVKSIYCQPAPARVRVVVHFTESTFDTKLSNHRFALLQLTIAERLAYEARERKAAFRRLPDPVFFRVAEPPQEDSTNHQPVDDQHDTIRVAVALPHYTHANFGWTVDEGLLSLLDYLYFTAYTITTTGYGDIRPVSPFSKFATTLGNLYEFIFIVLVFSLAMSGPDKDRPSGLTAATIDQAVAASGSIGKGAETTESKASEAGATRTKKRLREQ